MADEQVIIEIKVEDKEIAQASKHVDNLTDSIEGLGSSIKDARKQNKELKKQQDELSKSYADGAISTDKYEKEIGLLNTKIKSNNKLIATTSVELSKQKRERNANIKLVGSEVGSLRQLEAQASVLNIAISKQSKATKEGRKEYERLEEELGIVNEAVNKQRQAFKDNTKNIGNYTESINKSNLSLSQISGNLEDVGGATGDAVGGVKSLGASFKALLANPVVLVLSIIVAGLTALFSAFKKSESGSKLLDKAMAGLKGLFMIITKVADILAKGLTALFEDPQRAVSDLWEAIKTNIVNRFEGLISLFKAVGISLKALWSGDLDLLKKSANDASDAMIKIGTGLDKEQLQVIGKAISDTVAKTKDLVKAMLALDEAQKQQRISGRGLEKDISILNAELEVLSETLGDDTRNMHEMRKASQEALQVAVKLAQKEQQLAKQKLDIINQEVAVHRAAGENIQDLLDEQVQAEIQLVEARSKSAIEQQKILIEQRKIERDIFEQNLDIFLDVGAKLKQEREIAFSDEAKTLEERKKLLNASEVAQNANFESIKKEYELYGITSQQIEGVIRQETAESANEKLKALGLNEIANNRLREIILDRKQDEIDSNKLNKELDNEALERKTKATDTIKGLENDKSKFLIEKEIEKLEAVENSTGQRLELERKLKDQLVKFEEAKLALFLEKENLTAEERKALKLQTELDILAIEDEFSAIKNENALANKELDEERFNDFLETTRERFAEISAITAEFAGEEFLIFGGIAESIAVAFEEGKISTESALQGLLQASNAVFSALNAKREGQLLDLENQKQKELELAGDSEEAKLAIEEKFNKEQAKIKLKQFNADKAFAVIQIALNTAIAATKAFSQLGPIAGAIAVAAIAIFGGVQAGIVLSKQPPAFGGGASDIVGIGGSHASGNDVTVVGYDRSGNSQIFGRVEKGEAMPVIRKSAVNDYHVARMNGKISGSSNNRIFAEGTADITEAQQVQNNVSVADLTIAMSQVKIVAKIEDITESANNKIIIEDNAVI